MKALRRVADDPPSIPRCQVPAEPPAIPSTLDDRTTDYVIAVQEGFELLNDAARQAAAALILAAAGARPAGDHPALIHARRNLDEACDRIRAARPSRGADHHRRHLEQAAIWLREALAQAPRDAQNALRALGRAADHLRWAAAALPGFELVDLAQGCACHRRNAIAARPAELGGPLRG